MEMSEKILNHTLEIIYLLTGEALLLQHLTNSLITTERDKDMYERILTHALSIIYVLTGEEYTIVKKNPPHSHHLTGECDIDTHKEMVDKNHQTLRTLGIPANRSSDLYDENVDNVTKERLEEMDILQVTIDSDLCAGLCNVRHSTFPKQEINMAYDQKVKEEEIPVNISEGLQDENIETVSEEGEGEMDERDILQVTIQSELCTEPSNVKLSQLQQEEEPNGWCHEQAKEEEIPINITEDGSIDRNACGRNQGSDKSLTQIFQGAFYTDTPSKNGSNSEIISLAKAFECTACGKYFTEKNYLVRHQRIHTGETLISCSECGKCFIQKATLVEHQRTHTGVKPFACSHCGKCFIKKFNLDMHQRIHMSEKQFACSECTKCFQQKSYLVKHYQRVHVRRKPFACPECEKCFTDQSHLIRHQLLHTGEKPFPCSECGKSFTQQGNLVKHMRIHTGEKPFACFECGKSFTQSSHLTSHKKSHKCERLFECSEPRICL
ncbi:uncharacterized protein O3C94_016772 [Discoglossus pictus]